MIMMVASKILYDASVEIACGCDAVRLLRAPPNQTGFCARLESVITKGRDDLVFCTCMRVYVRVAVDGSG